jgi:4-amino-4-deoxy-L-arabinose transferase-like glycosyltransferase
MEAREPERAHRVLLAGIVVAGVALRAFRLDWGLPTYAFFDEVMYFVRGGAALAANGVWVPQHFNHPPLLNYVMAVVFAAWSLLRGEAVAAAGAPFYAQLGTLTLLGRGATVVMSGCTILVLYLVARRLIGSRGALLAAAVFAVAPLPVLESHRITPDVPLMLSMMLATLVAIAAQAERRPGLMLAAFSLAGVAGGFKYTGSSIAAVPAWLTLTWPGERWGVRIRWLAAGVGLMVASLLLACLAVFFDWGKFWFTVTRLISWTYLIGMPGVDLAGVGWPYARYVYPLVVAFPYMMGWAAYLFALFGLVLMVVTARWAAGVVLAFVVPYFGIMGGADTVVARYYLPLAPFFAIVAGFALDRGMSGSPVRRRAGLVVAVAVIGYTAVLTGSHSLRLGLGPQRQVVALLDGAARARTDGSLVVAYPSFFVLEYDAVKGIRSIPNTTIVYFPTPYQNPRLEPDAPPPDEAASLASDRQWIEKNDVRAIVLPSFFESAVRRQRPDGTTVRFYRRLADGTLGFRLAGDFRTRFWTQGLYTWSDPMLDTLWEEGIAGYKVFLRADDAPAA